MVKTGKCPSCKKTLLNVRAEAIELTENFTPTWKGASFVCPHCNCILSVGFDPLALKAGIVDEVVKRLKSGA
jgi:hypothetical protein